MAISIPVATAVAGTIIASSITWGLNTHTRINSLEEFKQEGKRFTQEDAEKAVGKIEKNHEAIIRVESKLDILLDNIKKSNG